MRTCVCKCVRCACSPACVRAIGSSVYYKGLPAPSAAHSLHSTPAQTWGRSKTRCPPSTRSCWLGGACAAHCTGQGSPCRSEWLPRCSLTAYGVSFCWTRAGLYLWICTQGLHHHCPFLTPHNHALRPDPSVRLCNKSLTAPSRTLPPPHPQPRRFCGSAVHSAETAGRACALTTLAFGGEGF